MQVGDVVNMTHWTHFQPNIQASYRAPKGRVGVFLLLGDADKKAPETFDAVGAIRALGWVPCTETDEADDLLAATSLEAGEKINKLENLLRDVERRILKMQACVPMSRRESANATKIRADIKRHLGVIK